MQKKYSDRKNDEKARAAFDQMTNDGVERKFDCIIVASMYYCGPDFPAVRQAIKETLYATGIDLIVLEEGLDTRAVSRKEVEDYFEAKRCEMHAEIMFAWRKKQGAGFRLTNSVPFGYIRRNGESNMIKDEEVAPYLSEAFSRYASGRKMRDIAKWLNEQGVDPPMKHKKRILGKPYDAEPDQWTTDMLRCLFRNPTYTGAAANGSRQIIAENCHEPYITKEQFHAFPCNLREGEKDISLIHSQQVGVQDRCCIFEGFMDFLSYKTLEKRGDNVICIQEPCDYIVLNSISSLGKCMERLACYTAIHCYLDNDQAGTVAAHTIMDRYQNRAINESIRYAEYKDVNDYLIGRKRMYKTIIFYGESQYSP